MENKKKVLYVDDEYMNLQLFEMTFRSKFEVITSCSGHEGLNHLASHPDIQVVISDMKMPKMNGLEFISKAKEEYNDKKYFILTGFDYSEEINKAVDENLILTYFSKPFNKQEIERAIEQ